MVYQKTLELTRIPLTSWGPHSIRRINIQHHPNPNNSNYERFNCNNINIC